MESEKRRFPKPPLPPRKATACARVATLPPPTSPSRPISSSSSAAQKRRRLESAAGCAAAFDRGDLTKALTLMESSRFIFKKIKRHRKNVSGEVKNFWNSIPLEEKREFLNSRIDEVKRYCDKFKQISGAEDLQLGIDHFQASKSWKYWDCCQCEDRIFLDKDSLTKHLKKEHVAALPENCRRIIPARIDPKTAQTILNGMWTPLDTVKVVKMIEDGENPSSWPLSDDHERSYLLLKIRSHFQFLVGNKCFAANYLVKLRRTAMVELNQQLQTQTHGLDELPLCFTLLGASPLKNIVRIFDSFISAAGLKNTPFFVEDSNHKNEPKQALNISGDAYDHDPMLESDSSTVEERLKAWREMKDEKDGLAADIYAKIEAQFSFVEQALDEKNRIRNIYKEKFANAEAMDSEQRAFGYILKKNMEEEIAARKDSLATILAEAQDDRTKEGSYHEYMDHLTKLEGLILGDLAYIERLYCELAEASAYDYRFIIVPLLRSFIQEKLEDLSHKRVLLAEDGAEAEGHE